MIKEVNKQNEEFIKNFESKVKQTIKKYSLCSKRDKIAVAVSGGKDSTAVLYLLKKFGYDVFALHIDLGMGDYSKKCQDLLKKFCKEYGIKRHIVEMKKIFGCTMCYIREGVQSKEKLSNCTICGIIKKWLLNKYARKFKATKIATGHNIDDEAETILVNFFKGNPYLGANSSPSVGVLQDKKFVTRIKPLYFCHNSETKRYALNMNFDVVGKCPCAFGTFRLRTRAFLDKFEQEESDLMKEKIVENFLSILPELRKKAEKGELKHCKNCGEPSRNEICKTCEIWGKFKVR